MFSLMAFQDVRNPLIGILDVGPLAEHPNNTLVPFNSKIDSREKDDSKSNYTYRQLKGFKGERYVAKRLRKYNVKFMSNPLDNIANWKHHVGKGADFKIPSYRIEIEVKNVNGKIFKSWIKRDVLPRFSYKNEKRILVINPHTKLSNEALELLFSYDIFLCTFDSLKFIIPECNKILESKKSNRVTYNTFSMFSALKIMNYLSFKRDKNLSSSPDGLYIVDHRWYSRLGYLMFDGAQPNSLDAYSNFNAESDLIRRHMKTATLDLKKYFYDLQPSLCRVCYRRYKKSCDLINELDRTKDEFMRFKDGQLKLDMMLEGYSKQELLEEKRKAKKRYLKIKNKCLKCMNRRLWLQINKGYNMFNINELNSFEG